MGPNKAWKMNSGSFWTPWCHTAFALRYLWWDCLPYLNHVQLTQLVQSSINLDGSLPPVLFLSASLLSDAVMCIAGEFLHAESSWWDPILDIILSASVSSLPEVVFFFCAQRTSSCLYFWKIWNTVLIHVRVWQVKSSLNSWEDGSVNIEFWDEQLCWSVSSALIIIVLGK